MKIKTLTQQDLSQLDPFLFPSDTDFRFTLLILATISASTFVFDFISPIDIFSFALTGKVNETYHVIIVFLNILLVFLLALGLYSIYPHIKIKKGKYSQIGLDNMPEIADYLKSLCEESGINKAPIFLVNPTNPVCTGVAFGRFSKNYIAITGGLVTKFFTDKFSFRAVVLHELAHLDNGDIQKTYLSIAIWQSFTILTLIPFFLLLIPSLLLGNLLDVGVAFGLGALLLIGIVYFMRNKVLQSRELYADARSLQWLGRENRLQLIKLFSQNPKKNSLFSSHPDYHNRAETILHPEKFFLLNPIDTFYIGLVSSTTIHNLFYFAFGFEYSEIISSLLITPFVAGIISFLIWRTVYFFIITGVENKSSLEHSALFFGFGFLFGFATSFSGYLDTYLNTFSLSSLDVFLLICVLFFQSIVFFTWIQKSLFAWRKTILRSQAMKKFFFFFSIFSGIYLSILIGLENEFSVYTPLSTIKLQNLSAYPTIPFLILGISILTWIIPIFPSFIQRIAFSKPEPNADYQQIKIRNPYVLFVIVGVIGNVIFFIVSSVYKLDNVLNWLKGDIFLVVIIQFFAVLATTVFIKESDWVDGLFTAFITGTIIVSSVFLQDFFLNNMESYLGLEIIYIYSQIIDIGFVFILPFLLIASKIK